MKVRSVVLPLLVVTCLVYVLQFLFDWFTPLFMLMQGDVLARPWTLFTSMFLHSLASPFHLLFNMLVLFFFGPVVEQMLGWKRFLGLYIGAGVFAALVASFIYPAALGASGAIMGVLGVAVVLMPKMKVLLWGIVPMTLRTLIILVVIIDIINTIGDTNIATYAHFAGLACGMLYAMTLRKQKKQVHKKIDSKFELDEDDLNDYLRSGRL